MRWLVVVVGCAACGRGFFNPQPHDGPAAGTDAPTTSVPISYVQSGAASTMADVLAVPLPLAQRVGDTNIVVVAWAGGAIATLDDDNHNTYSTSIGPISTANNVSQSIFYATNIVPGANQIRIELSIQTPNYFTATVLEYAGVDTVQPIDASVGSQGGATAAASGELHLSSDGDLEVAAVSSDSTFSTTLPGFTLRSQGNNVLVEDVPCPTAGTFAAITDAAVAGNWVDEAIGLRRGN